MLIPIYQFAKENIRWRRVSWQLNDNGEIKCDTPNFDDLMTFTDGVLSALERAKRHHLEHLTHFVIH